MAMNTWKCVCQHSNLKCVPGEDLDQGLCWKPGNYVSLSFFPKSSARNPQRLSFPVKCYPPWLHSWAALTDCPARGSADTVTMCLGHRGRETCEHRNAVFNVLRLPAHSRGTPGKNWRVTIMTMNSFIKGASVRKIWPSGDRDAGPNWLKLQGMECMHRGGDAPAQIPPTCSAVLSTHSIFRISSWWKQDGCHLPKWDIQKQNTIGWQMRAWLLVFVFLETRTTFPKVPSTHQPSYMSHWPEAGHKPTPKSVTGERTVSDKLA